MKKEISAPPGFFFIVVSVSNAEASYFVSEAGPLTRFPAEAYPIKANIAGRIALLLKGFEQVSEVALSRRIVFDAGNPLEDKFSEN